MEGNYSALMPKRFARTTGIILLGDGRWANFGRYVRRTVFQRTACPGSLAGDKDSLKWEMVQWILIAQPRLRERNRKMLHAAGLPMIELNSMREVEALYEAWGLERRQAS